MQQVASDSPTPAALANVFLLAASNQREYLATQLWQYDVPQCQSRRSLRELEEALDFACGVKDVAVPVTQGHGQAELSDQTGEQQFEALVLALNGRSQA